MSSTRFPTSIPRTRKDYAAKYPKPNMTLARNDGHGTIDTYNPTIDRVKRGQLISCWATPRSTTKQFGYVVESVDVERGLVHVGQSVGYPKEQFRWIPIADVIVVWGEHTYEEIIRQSHAFTRALLVADLEASAL